MAVYAVGFVATCTTGRTLVETRLRSEIVRESRLVLDFADECRFWVALKPSVA